MLTLITELISPMALFWLVAMIVLCIVEASTVGLVSIWFATGALAALIAAAAGGALWMQITLFLVVSGIMLALLRPMIKRIVLPKTTATNADRHLGKTALVTEEINNLQETGSVKLDGVIWTARSGTDEVIPEGTVITVLRIEGVKAIVEPVKNAVEV